MDNAWCARIELHSLSNVSSSNCNLDYKANVANYLYRPLKEGAAVTYNGTDFLVQDDCTGQIKEVNIAGDSISYFHAMGLDAVTV